ncbi:flavin reductase family protein [Spongiibacter sp. KMU-166]|uniref:Flavin reductase family protein n=1 Tax=Spongiibacter thalassae TaxID=2721624 RepID=A0ABX1GBL8_9GAMM|nr:flavin reductase family protein [Spongiibacter thalassae]NKI16564.1 flavin reductase family protein [Spongiibacter thalassae]
MTSPHPVDPKVLRSALGSFTTGVTVVTTRNDGQDAGVTVNSFNSVSLDPPMVLWSLAKSAGSFPTYHSAEHFAVHILAADQEPLSQRFATKGIDKFAEVDFHRGVGDVPILDGCSAVFHCKTVYRYEGGDHEIYVGQVEKLEHFDRQPLVFHGGKYALAVPKKKPESVADDTRARGFSANSLTYLMGLVYFQLMQRATAQLGQRGITEAEMAALNILAIDDGRSATEIDAMVRISGYRIDDDVLKHMADKNLVALTEAADGLRANLLEAGRELQLEQVAFIQALEDDALPEGAYAETVLAKELLKTTARKLLKS